MSYLPASGLNHLEKLPDGTKPLQQVGDQVLHVFQEEGVHGVLQNDSVDNLLRASAGDQDAQRTVSTNDMSFYFSDGAQGGYHIANFSVGEGRVLSCSGATGLSIADNGQVFVDEAGVLGQALHVIAAYVNQYITPRGLDYAPGL